MQQAFQAGRAGTRLIPTPRSSASASSSRTNDNSPIPSPSIYLSLHLTLSFLLIFSFLFLPRTSIYLYSPSSSPPLSQKSSLDRPEHPFLTAITANPIGTMIWVNVGIWICMTWWGGWLKVWWREEKIRKGEMRDSNSGDVVKDREQKQTEMWKMFITYSNSIILTLFSSLLIHIVLLLLGAPLSTYHPQTFLLSLQISLICIYPVAIALGIPSLYKDGEMDRWRLRRLFSELDARTSLEKITLYPLFLSLVFTWLGVIPLALDWDRPWQAYPLPPAFGGIVGYILGGLWAWGRMVVDEVEGKVLEEKERETEKVGEEGKESGGKGRKKKKAVKSE